MERESLFRRAHRCVVPMFSFGLASLVAVFAYLLIGAWLAAWIALAAAILSMTASILCDVVAERQTLRERSKQKQETSLAA